MQQGGRNKRYEARYYISGKGVNGNLVRSWEVPELPEDRRREILLLPPDICLYSFLGNAIMLEIGYHVSIAGDMDLAFDRAAKIGCTAMQVFLGNPRGWGAKHRPRGGRDFKTKLKRFGAEKVFAHMAYLPNIASPNEFAYRKSVEALEFSLRRCDLLGIRFLVTHLGSHLGQGREIGFVGPWRR